MQLLPYHLLKQTIFLLTPSLTLEVRDLSSYISLAIPASKSRMRRNSPIQNVQKKPRIIYLNGSLFQIMCYTIGTFNSLFGEVKEESFYYGFKSKANGSFLGLNKSMFGEI